MTTTTVLLCLAAMLTIYSDSTAQGINCRRFVYHPKCRGVAAKRADLHPLASLHRHSDRKQAFHPMCRGVAAKRATPLSNVIHHADRKPEDDLSEQDTMYIPSSVDATSEALQGAPRHNPALWSYLAERPVNYLLPYRKFDPDTLELNYDYE